MKREIEKESHVVGVIYDVPCNGYLEYLNLSNYIPDINLTSMNGTQPELHEGICVRILIHNLLFSINEKGAWHGMLLIQM
jgi:hypothetical protein